MILIGTDEGYEAVESGLDCISQELKFNNFSDEDLTLMFSKLNDYRFRLSGLIKHIKFELEERGFIK